MLQKNLLGVFLVFSLAGCATAPVDQAAIDLRAWAPTALQEARDGSRRWSDYYTEFYNRLRDTNFADRAFLMEVTANLIDVARAFEAGAISEQQFDSARRQAEVAVTRNTEQLTREQDAARRAAWAATMNNLAQSQQQRSNYFQQHLNRQQTCTSQWVGTTWQTVCR